MITLWMFLSTCYFEFCRANQRKNTSIKRIKRYAVRSSQREISYKAANVIERKPQPEVLLATGQSHNTTKIHSREQEQMILSNTSDKKVTTSLTSNTNDVDLDNFFRSVGKLE